MSLVIVGAGIASPLGVGVRCVSAAWRGGVSGLHEHPSAITLRGSPPVVGAALPFRAWPDRKRWSDLALAALQDSLAQLPQSARERAVSVLIAVPSARPGRPVTLEQDLSDTISHALRTVVRVTRVECVRDDACAGIAALQLAANHLSPDEMCLVLGVDSWLDPDALEWLDSGGRLHGGGHRQPTLWGIVPGEAAAALWVVRQNASITYGRLAVRGIGVATEPARPQTDAVITGKNLFAAIRATLHDVGDDVPVSAIITDSGAAPWRAEEWALASMGLRGAMANDIPLWTPADRWGDLGAATAAAVLALCTDLLNRRPLYSTRAMITTMAESGARACAIVDGVLATDLAEVSEFDHTPQIRSAA